MKNRRGNIRFSAIVTDWIYLSAEELFETTKWKVEAGDSTNLEEAEVIATCSRFAWAVRRGRKLRYSWSLQLRLSPAGYRDQSTA